MRAMDSKLHINLQLDAHRIPLHIEREQEEFYRQAGVLLNQRYQAYQRMRPSASAEQLWAYVALDVAVNLCSDARDKSLAPVEKQLKELNREMEKILK